MLKMEKSDHNLPREGLFNVLREEGLPSSPYSHIALRTTYHDNIDHLSNIDIEISCYENIYSPVVPVVKKELFFSSSR